MKKEEQKINYNILFIVAAVVIMILMIGFLCFNYFLKGNNNKKENEVEKKETIVNVINKNSVMLNQNKTNTISNEKCSKSSIRKKYSLTLQDGVIQVNNLDTMENFIMNKFVNVSTILELNYDKTCDTVIYVLLTFDGEVYYTYDDISKITDVRNIDTNFKLLKTDLRFTDIYVGYENNITDLYGKTSTDNLYKIDLR